MNPWHLTLAALLCLAACAPQKSRLEDQRFVDLTHPFGAETIYWPTGKDFVLEKVFEGMTEEGYYYTANRFRAAEHGGTHLDAPTHFHRDGRTVDEIPIEQMIGRGVTIDLSQKVQGNPDYQISAEDLLEWEKSYGQIPKESIVLLRTDYGTFWPDRKTYLGTEERGETALKKLHFPGLHPSGARWLAEHRSVKAVGIDTASIDYGQTANYLSHQILTKFNILILENIANLKLLPKRGFTVVALPMKIEGGSGAPLRIIAILPQER